MHPGKRQVLSIIHNKNIIDYDYTPFGNKLEQISTAKYIRITLSHVRTKTLPTSLAKQIEPLDS